MTSKMYLIITNTRGVPIFKVAWPLQVCQLVTHRHIYEDFLKFYLTKFSCKSWNQIERR